MEEDKIFNDEVGKEIKKRAERTSEGDEAIADYTYDEFYKNEDEVLDDYRD